MKSDEKVNSQQIKRKKEPSPVEAKREPSPVETKREPSIGGVSVLKR